MDFWKAIRDFDAETADAHFCWALVEMENERYVTIRGGKITPTEKCMIVSPQSILDRPVVVWECNVAQAMLIMEARGMVTIQNGIVALTDLGKEYVRNLKLTDEGKEYVRRLRLAEMPPKQESGRDVEVDDDFYAYLQTRLMPGETENDLLKRLLGIADLAQKPPGSEPEPDAGLVAYLESRLLPGETEGDVLRRLMGFN